MKHHPCNGAGMSQESDRRQQILDAAFAEFAAKGFKGATIKSIARAAGLQSPSLIYWYFPTKEELFQAMLQARLHLFQVISQSAALLDQPPQEVLPQIATAYLDITNQPEINTMARLVFSEVVTRPEIADVFATRFIQQILEFLKTYLNHQIDLGHLRPHDTRASARAFIGMMLPQMLSFLLFPSLRSDGLSNETHVATAVEIFLSGLWPEP
ncbi:MAG: TetR/AcrR family transcriptional regulator [Chloroflexi bacterium]|nr:TetR/AcrR family transcriptional regulator [Chloroflexota bacterium]